jgi:hypothetical protein
MDIFSGDPSQRPIAADWSSDNGRRVCMDGQAGRREKRRVEALQIWQLTGTLTHVGDHIHSRQMYSPSLELHDNEIIITYVVASVPVLHATPYCSLCFSRYIWLTFLCVCSTSNGADSN